GRELALTTPSDDEIAGCVERNGRTDLGAGRVGVDAEFAAQRGPRGGVALGVDPPRVAVLAVTLPGDDEVAGTIHGDRAKILNVGGVSVDLKFTSLGLPLGVVPLGVHSVAAAVLQTRPGDHAVAGRVHRDRWRKLGIGRVRVDVKLGARG